jgi:predicted nucleic acid-binding protein
MDAGDRDHQASAELFIDTRERLLVPAPVVVELDWLLRSPPVHAFFDRFLAAVEEGSVEVVDLTPADYSRVRDLCQQYSGLRLGFVDAGVIAVAERLGEPTIATLDRRHFSVVRPAGGGHFNLVPAEAG